MVYSPVKNKPLMGMLDRPVESDEAKYQQYNESNCHGVHVSGLLVQNISRQKECECSSQTESQWKQFRMLRKKVSHHSQGKNNFAEIVEVLRYIFTLPFGHTLVISGCGEKVKLPCET